MAERLPPALAGDNYPKGEAARRIAALKEAHGPAKAFIAARALELGLALIERDPHLLIVIPAPQPQEAAAAK